MARSDPPLFDPAKARGPRRKPDVGVAQTDAKTDRGAMSVSSLITRVKAALAQSFPKTVTVLGEISNCTLASSGHLYFSLKDANATIPCAMWRPQASRLKFTPENGLEVIVTGRVDVYEAQGKLQLYVNSLTPKGAGALELAFRQLKEKLQAKGLFEPGRKKPLPRFPRAIGVVTSPTGAAIRDIGRTLRRRWPGARVYLAPVAVQGDGSAEQVAAAIADLDAAAARLEIDTLIIGRGGGSLEDLWAFNEEAVARAIANARTPIISGVGHEVDVTIADMVADVRAATPTAAAELAVPDRAEIAARVGDLSARLTGGVNRLVDDGAEALRGVLRSVVFRDPTWRLRSATQRMDELSIRLPGGLKDRLAAARRRLEPAANHLAALHPARLAERAGALLGRLTGRLAWALGGPAKRQGDRLAAALTRLQAVHPRHQLDLARQRVLSAQRQLEALSYRGTLKRGFSVTRSATGELLRSAGQIQSGDRLETELTHGLIVSGVDGGPIGPQRRRRKRADAPAQGGLFDPPSDTDTQPPA